MPLDFDIEEWLRAHSAKVHLSPQEVLFEHPGDEYSLLLFHAFDKTTVTDFRCRFLASFYESFNGGYIGGGFLLIGAATTGSVKTSTGITVPSLSQLRAIAESEGMNFEDDETPFMTTGYMFVYSFLADGRLRCHDRDLKTVTETTIGEIVDTWWKIKIADE
jgi:hypothetical protein